MNKQTKVWRIMKTIFFVVSCLLLSHSSCVAQPELERLTALSPVRWEEIKQHFFEDSRDFMVAMNYRPHVGDVCFIGMNDVGGTTPEATKEWSEMFWNEWVRMGSIVGKIPGEQFINSAVASSNGKLIKLAEGTRVRVLAGVLVSSGEKGFEDPGGKLEILSGPSVGRVCYNLGAALQGQYSGKPVEFLKTELDKKAMQGIFTYRTLISPSLTGTDVLTPVELQQNKLLFPSTFVQMNMVLNLWDRANQGDAVAQYNLGMLYEQGKGVQHSYTEALGWYRKSAAQGFPYAVQRLGGLAH